MGRGGRGKRRGRSKGEDANEKGKGKPGEWKLVDTRTVLAKNEALEEYYGKQAFLEEGELGSMMDAMRKPLPVTFRVNQTCPYAARCAPDPLEGSAGRRKS